MEGLGSRGGDYSVEASLVGGSRALGFRTWYFCRLCRCDRLRAVLYYSTKWSS